MVMGARVTTFPATVFGSGSGAAGLARSPLPTKAPTARSTSTATTMMTSFLRDFLDLPPFSVLPAASGRTVVVTDMSGSREWWRDLDGGCRRDGGVGQDDDRDPPVARAAGRAVSGEQLALVGVPGGCDFRGIDPVAEKVAQDGCCALGRKLPVRGETRVADRLVVGVALDDQTVGQVL